ncbi:MAG: clostripain-related cysteine peptidase, partial [Bacteroidota bacterium]
MLVYVVGTDIVEDAITDLAEMRAAGNTDNINIVVLKGGAKIDGWEKPATSLLVDGEEIPQSFLPSDDFMVSTTNLSEFIDYGTTNFPAEKYFLAFYNHGMAIRGWGWDNTTDTQFKVVDLKTGIENSNFIQQGNKFEVLGFDACLMACIEAQSAFQEFAHYYIASEETESGHAWNWTPIISEMNNNMDSDGANLGQLIVDTYIQHSKDNNTHHVTLSVTDMAKVADLEQAIETTLAAINTDDLMVSFLQARGKSEEYSKSISEPAQSEDVVDIGDLFTQLGQLAPSLLPQINTTLEKLGEAVVYERSDATRPKASGISMFVPLNLFADEALLDDSVEEQYKTIPFSAVIQNFITNDYLSYTAIDNEPIDGAFDNSLGLIANSSNSNARNSGERYSAFKLQPEQVKELHQVQVILLEEIVGIPDEFLVLGSTHADTIVENADGSEIYGYEWDEEWLSLNGFPVYVADIQDFEILDANGNVATTITKLHIPAVLNPSTAEARNISFSYIVDENQNYELEGILRESYESESGFLVTSKERIELQPGDEIQLIYEIFDAATNAATFQADPNTLITIENGNQDLKIGHAPLNAGKYHIGFVLM